MAAKSLRTVIYIITKKIFEVKTSSIIRNFFDIAATIFVCIIPIIKLDNEKFWLYYLSD